MNWKLKATIQNAVSLLPPTASYASYYWIQRHFGALRRLSPISRLSAGVETWKRILGHGCVPSQKTFLEIGTGRVPLVPLSYWLMGADRTITVDLNPYLKEELVRESVGYIAANRAEIEQLFGALLQHDRLDALLHVNRSGKLSLAAFLNLCRIEYAAPCDAARTNLPAHSVDFHTSYTVFEHIPANVLADILREGNRLTRTHGLFVHRIDYSDHFSHTDPSISAINFLQYSDDEWARFAGNRYMYMNRLRHDDYLALFQDAGHCVLEAELDRDPRSDELLRSGALRLDHRFRSRSHEVLAISASWIVSRKQGA